MKELIRPTDEQILDSISKHNRKELISARVIGVVFKKDEKFEFRFKDRIYNFETEDIMRETLKDSGWLRDCFIDKEKLIGIGAHDLYELYDYPCFDISRNFMLNSGSHVLY